MQQWLCCYDSAAMGNKAVQNLHTNPVSDCLGGFRAMFSHWRDETTDDCLRSRIQFHLLLKGKATITKFNVSIKRAEPTILIATHR